MPVTTYDKEVSEVYVVRWKGTGYRGMPVDKSQVFLTEKNARKAFRDYGGNITVTLTRLSHGEVVEVVEPQQD